MEVIVLCEGCIFAAALINFHAPISRTVIEALKDVGISKRVNPLIHSVDQVWVADLYGNVS